MAPTPLRSLRHATALTVALLLALSLLAAPPARAATETEGYLELSDGTSLRYTLLTPEGEGPFPTVMQYSGYNNGNNPYDGTFGKMVDQVVDAGIAVIGVNLRGSGCSAGTFSPFTTQWADDGVEVVEWVAEQPWSDGNVAMAGVSYPAILSLVTAAKRPPSLRAIVADVPVVDLYRDVAYPGGMWNSTFSSAWSVIQKYGTLFAQQEIAEGDDRCAANIPTQNDPTDTTVGRAATSPHIDSFGRYTDFLMPEHLAEIEVPALVYTAWQDEQLGSRSMHAYEYLDPERRWVVGSNGDHIGFSGSPWYQEQMLDFLDHFLRGGATDGYDAARVRIARDVRKGGASFDELDSYDTYPVPTVTTTLVADGTDLSLRLTTPTDATELSFDAPLPAGSVPVGIDVGAGANPEVYSEAFKAPVPPQGAVALTTPALAEDVQLHGPASLDLWLSSTHSDADLQVTLTEVRPDGQELYVQRGWLRASRRELDPTRTTVTRPVPTYLEADVAPLPAGEPTPVRIEIWPVDHVFRAGSALRVSVESPVGMTGFRQLAFDPTPAVHTLHVGPDTPTSLTFGRIAAPQVATALPPCDTLLNMPCRTSATAPPAGTLTFASNPGATAPTGEQEPAAATGDGSSLPATGGGALLPAVALLATAITLRRR